jgi:putative hydrolase of the HAD superfamily
VYHDGVYELPRAILFDLDDTILSAYRDADKAWRTVVEEHRALLEPLDPDAVTRAILDHAREFWADPSRHRYWRLRLAQSRREVVRGAFAKLALEARSLSDEVAVRVADRFTRLRDEQMYVFPGACETLDVLRQRGIALALLTNGSSEIQRAKLMRFDLLRRFDHIQIEGEHGFGKPEERAYLHAMQALSVTAAETWIVGDNLEWEVVAPQRLGIHAIWHDADGKGVPLDSPVRPDRTIRALSELLPVLELGR